MKKKLLIALLAIVASLGLALGLAACSDDEEVSGSKWGDVFTIETAYAQAEELGYTGSLEEFIATISGKDGADGKDGVDGKDGADGKDGVDGKDGADGVGIANMYIENGSLYVVLDDYTVINCGAVSTATTACDHAYGEWETVLEPTCTSIGYDTRTCSLCGDVDYRFTPATGHNLSSDTEYEVYSTTHATFCSDCGMYVAVEHDFDEYGDCATCGLGLKYQLNSDGKSYTVTGVTSQAAVHAIVIPNEHNGYPVTAIADSAFNNSSALFNITATSVTIGNNVTKIGSDAFSNCTSLTYITIGNSVTTIGNNAFSECTSLTRITIPDSVTSIGDSAFWWCTSLTSITIGNSVATIGSNTFYGCSALTSITIPNSVKSIREWAFYGCTSLTSVTMGNSVATIGNSAFYNCKALTSITIPNSVTSIGDEAFYNCTSLTSVSIPDSVKNIGDLAFHNCTSLTEITVSGNNGAYCGVDGVLFNKDKTELIVYPAGKTAASYKVPDGVISIGDYAFSGCTVLTSISIPDTVTSIGRYAFANCTAEIVWGDNQITEIGDYAFARYAGTSMTIPDSVTDISECAFYYCTSLKNIIIPIGVTNIGYDALYGCRNILIFCEADSQPSGWADRWNSSNRTVIWGWTDTEITYTFVSNGGSEVASITSGIGIILPTPTKDGYVFGGWYDNENLEGSVKYGTYYSAENITLYARWYDIDGLEQSEGLEIVDGVIVGIGSCTDSILVLNMPIAEHAFYACDTITMVIFGPGVISIGYQAFGDSGIGCDNLTGAVFTTEEPPVIASDIFGSTWNHSAGFIVYVPEGSLELYEAVDDEYWQMYLVSEGLIEEYSDLSDIFEWQ